MPPCFPGNDCSRQIRRKTIDRAPPGAPEAPDGDGLFRPRPPSRDGGWRFSRASPGDSHKAGGNNPPPEAQAYPGRHEKTRPATRDPFLHLTPKKEGVPS
jgi:hypothetical protein